MSIYSSYDYRLVEIDGIFCWDDGQSYNRTIFSWKNKDCDFGKNLLENGIPRFYTHTAHEDHMSDHELQRRPSFYKGGRWETLKTMFGSQYQERLPASEYF